VNWANKGLGCLILIVLDRSVSMNSGTMPLSILIPRFPFSCTKRFPAAYGASSLLGAPSSIASTPITVAPSPLLNSTKLSSLLDTAYRRDSSPCFIRHMTAADEMHSVSTFLSKRVSV
jgi:hypothetical protein